MKLFSLSHSHSPRCRRGVAGQNFGTNCSSGSAWDLVKQKLFQKRWKKRKRGRSIMFAIRYLLLLLCCCFFSKVASKFSSLFSSLRCFGKSNGELFFFCTIKKYFQNVSNNQFKCRMSISFSFRMNLKWPSRNVVIWLQFRCIFFCVYFIYCYLKMT